MCLHACAYVCVCVCAVQIEFFPLSAILKKRAYSALIEFVLHGLLCSLFVEAKRANNQPSCQLATLKAAFFPRRNVIMNTPISPPLTRFEMPTAANEDRKRPVHAVRLHLLQLTTRRRDWRWSDHLCIAIDFIAGPRGNQWTQSRGGRWSGIRKMLFQASGGEAPHKKGKIECRKNATRTAGRAGSASG